MGQKTGKREKVVREGFDREGCVVVGEGVSGMWGRTSHAFIACVRSACTDVERSSCRMSDWIDRAASLCRTFSSRLSASSDATACSALNSSPAKPFTASNSSGGMCSLRSLGRPDGADCSSAVMSRTAAGEREEGLEGLEEDAEVEGDVTVGFFPLTASHMWICRSHCLLTSTSSSMMCSFLLNSSSSCRSWLRRSVRSTCSTSALLSRTRSSVSLSSSSLRVCIRRECCSAYSSRTRW